MPSGTIEATSTARYRVVALASALAMVTPSYLLQRHGFNISGMALFAGLPLPVSSPAICSAAR